MHKFEVTEPIRRTYADFPHPPRTFTALRDVKLKVHCPVSATQNVERHVCRMQSLIFLLG